MKNILGDICSFQSGGTPSKTNADYYCGDIPWITTVALNGQTIGKTAAVDWITEKAIKESAAKIVPARSIMVGTRVGVGKVAINEVPMSTNQDIISLVGVNELLWSKEYICRLIQSKETYLKSQARGATIKGIKIDVLASLDIPDVPLDSQQEIVVVLDKTQSILAARRLQLSALDDLIKARFVEMFGDPEASNRFPVKKLDALVTDIIAGWSANGEARQKNDNEKAVLKVSAVTQGYFRPEEHKALPSELEIKKYVFPKKGDLLFSRANTRELVGATAIIEQDYPDLLLPDKLWRVLFTNEINVYYVKYVLSTRSIRSQLSAQSTGTSGSMYNVSSDKFRNIAIPVPPKALQDSFEAFVHQIDKSKSAIQKSLDETQILFDSLMQKYFG